MGHATDFTATVVTHGDERKHILVVDDDPMLRSAYARILSRGGYAVVTASNGNEACEQLRMTRFDAVMSDIAMPEMDGLALLQTVRERGLDVPFVICTAAPGLDSAVIALEHGATAYLAKPFEPEALHRAIEKALHTRAHLALSRTFDTALASLSLVYQPIVSVATHRTSGFEALMRVSDRSFPHPGALLEAAERLGRLPELGRAVRARAAAGVASLPGEASLFVNLHSRDLVDEELYQRQAPLSKVAGRVILEITERASLDDVAELGGRIDALRALGYRIALDDLGAGYAGLSSFAAISPDVVKLDMSLVRGVDQAATRRRVVRSLTQLAHDLGIAVVAEGVETEPERDALVELGCDLLQGYLFARPAPIPPPIAW